jgi:hypothetical protein
MTQYDDDEAYLVGDDGGDAPYDDAPYDDAPRSRGRRQEPHRGTLILVLGILSLVVCAFIGPFAWMMGNEDMAKIRAGRMDREGEGITQAGRIMGIIATVLLGLGVLLFGFGMCAAVVGGGAASSNYGG